MIDTRLDWIEALPESFLIPLLTALALGDDTVIAAVVRRMARTKASLR